MIFECLLLNQNIQYMKYFFLLLVVLGSCDGKKVDACPNVGAPVCGSHSNTYGNSCYAEAQGIDSYVLGDCAN